MNLAPGSTFAWDYRIVRPLSAGGMGALFVVEQISTGQRRALKLMHSGLLQNEEMRRKFEQEARVGARIESEHVVQVVAAGIDQDSQTPFLVMELLDGEDLSAYVARRGPLPPNEVADIFEQLCHAVGAAHAAGIVHRDLKPENVFLAKARRAGAAFTVKVLDFGIAKLLSEGAGKSTAAMGSPMWLAPEQTERGAITPAADVWALGLIAFFLLSGRPYWSAATGDTSVAALMREILFEPMVAASVRAGERGATLPSGFDGVFARAVARAPHERFSEGHAFGAALLASLRGGGTIPSSDWRTLPTPPPAYGFGAAPTQVPFAPGSDSGAMRQATPALEPQMRYPTPAAAESRAPSSAGLVIGIIAMIMILVVGGVIAAFVMLRAPTVTVAVTPTTTSAPPAVVVSATSHAMDPPPLEPTPDPRDNAIAAWVAGPLSGGDNESAAARGARIVSKGDGYALTIDNQFKFTCSVDFDDKGAPKTLRNCVSAKASEGWSASPPAISVHCSTNAGYETCAGAYRLKNISMDQAGLFTFSRKLDGAPPVTTTTATTATTTSPPPTGPRSTADIQRVIAAARPRFKTCYDKGLAQDPNLSGKIPLTITIGPDGKVAAASVGSGATLVSPVVTTCVLGVSRSLVFPPSTESSTVNYPLIFTSAAKD